MSVILCGTILFFLAVAILIIAARLGRKKTRYIGRVRVVQRENKEKTDKTEKVAYDPNALCPGCMSAQLVMLPSGNHICPGCGYDQQEYGNNKNPRWLPIQTILAGKYMVGKVLGEGGFGITYLAWDLNRHLSVAIKEYFPSSLVTRDTTANNHGTISVMSGDNQIYYQKGLDGFEQEARTLAKLHALAGVVSVREFFRENNTAYLVMEYVKGISLKEYLKVNQSPMREDKILNIMGPLMEALETVHKEGIIHRDISPDNILIDGERVTLIDFGAARMSLGEESKSLTVLLKHGYAPPEQYQTKGRQGPWTDIYALCAMMYRMASGLVPEEAIDRMTEDEVVPLKVLRENNPDIQVSDRFSDVIQKGLALKKEERYSQIRELIQNLS
ncbi:MAG: serine/threonine protein kinase [Clostridia bacterium]|nr:serine/threonine protein kinase [Clostridia bacterium]